MAAAAAVLTPNDVRDGTDEQVGAALLHSPAVRVVIHVAHRLPRAEAAQDEVFAVGVDHVHELGVRRVQPRLRVLVLEQRPGRVQARDPAQVLQLGAGVTGRVRAQAETDQVHVLDRQAGLGRQARDQHGHLFADQPGVGRGPHVVRYDGACLPVHADDVAVHLKQHTGSAIRSCVITDLGRPRVSNQNKFIRFRRTFFFLTFSRILQTNPARGLGTIARPPI